MGSSGDFGDLGRLFVSDLVPCSALRSTIRQALAQPNAPTLGRECNWSVGFRSESRENGRERGLLPEHVPSKIAPLVANGDAMRFCEFLKPRFHAVCAVS
jgi:hypothetical protein